MKVSREKMAENRSRILTEAAVLFREKGFDAVSVAEVMKAAGLTHGGFYGHFASKDELIAQTVSHATTGSEGTKGFAAFAESYLSPRHRDASGQGCPTAALASDLRHQSAEARQAMAAGIEAQLAHIAAAMQRDSTTVIAPADLRRRAIGSWSAMVGAMIMARAVEDPGLADELLAGTLDWVRDAT
ncbi:TetR/AcrR family transcriptional regulator [Paracoccus aestuariivivens]|uniref:TetR family transcriptional regulator n=1 Tax=Paracoccus aestuariivivens TaxID=1820333 RepID=A0A6L6JDH1_9RHOB|nr:TetR/AcrR family transcriptional regulator [Paracoccus aestuariivivens]MTH80213.1 TetR family transcriptional regulator [Paracoccus aestuariivivens]